MKIQERRPNLFTATTVMERYFDEYDYFNFDRKYTEPQARKGRSKKESEQNTNRPSPAGHERKVSTKFQNADKNKKEKGQQLWRITQTPDKPLSDDDGRYTMEDR